MRHALEVTQETDIHRDFQVFALDNVRMTASAVQLYVPFHLAKMFFMVEIYTPFSEERLRFHQTLVMTTGLETVLVRDIGEGPRIVGPGKKHELTGYRLYRSIVVAFQAGHFVVS